MLRPPCAAVLGLLAALVAPPGAAAQLEAVGDEAAERSSAEPGEEGEGTPEAGAVLPSPPARGDPVTERRIAVLLVAAAGVEAETADALTELAIGAVAERGGARIVGKEELQSQLGQGEARTMECISSSACLGRVGVELAVDEIIAGTVGRRGDTWIFNINRIDVDSGEVAGRTFREVAGDLGTVADAIQAAVPSLFVAVPRPAVLLVSANVSGAEVLVDGVVVGVYRGVPVRLPDVPPGRHEVEVEAEGYLPWRRAVRVAEGATLQLEAVLEEPERPTEAHVSRLVWIGGGVAVAGGAAALLFGLSSQATYDGRDNRADAVEFVEDRRFDALLANIGMGAAAAGAVTLGLGLLLSDFGGEPAAPARVGVTPLGGGTILEVEGRY